MKKRHIVGSVVASLALIAGSLFSASSAQAASGKYAVEIYLISNKERIAENHYDLYVIATQDRISHFPSRKVALYDASQSQFAGLGMASTGYLLGFIVGGMLVGKLAELGCSRRPLQTAGSMVVGNLVIYSMGIPVLQAITGVDWATALQWGLYPFLIGDAIKIVLAAGLLPAAWAGMKLLHRPI